MKMELTEAVLKKHTKEGIIELTLDYQGNFNQDLKSIKKDLSKLKESSLNLKLNLLPPSKLTTFCVTRWFKLNENLGVMINTPDVNV